MQELPTCHIKFCSAIGCIGRNTLLIQQFRECIRSGCFSMNDKDLFHLLYVLNPKFQPFLVSMATHTLQLPNLCGNLYRFAEQCHIVCTLQQSPSQCADSLIADKQNRIFRLPEVVLQVMLNPSCFTHTARRNDNLAASVCIDCHRSFTGDSRPQPRYPDGIFSTLHIGKGFFIKAAFLVSLKDFCRLNGKRTIYINRDILILPKQILVFDLL